MVAILRSSIDKSPFTKDGERRWLSLFDKRVGDKIVRAERYSMEEKWLKNFFYWDGKQYIYIVNGQVYDATVNMPEHAVDYKVNLTRSILMRACMKVHATMPKMRAIPPNASMRARNIAEMSEKCVQHQRRVTGYDDRWRLLALQTAAICGSAFFRLDWDQTKGNVRRFYHDISGKLVDPLTLTPTRVQQFVDNGQITDFNEGEVSLSLEIPFAMLWDWTARAGGIPDAMWMSSRHIHDIDRVCETYNCERNGISSDVNPNTMIQYEEALAFQANAGSTPFTYGEPEEKRGERCIVDDMWQRPCREFPRGFRVVRAGGKIVFQGDNPNLADKSKKLHLPWFKQDWIKHPARFIGVSLVEDLTNPQYHLNSAASRILEFLKVFGNPPTFIDKNTGLDSKTLKTLLPGAAYFINANSRLPTTGPVPQIPNGVVQAHEMSQAHLQQVGSSSDIDGSKLPGQMRTGAAIGRMNDERYVVLGASAVEANVAMREIAEGMLAMGQMKYTEPRLARILGEDNQYIVSVFTGADLTSELEIVGDFTEIDRQVRVRGEIQDAVESQSIQPATNPDHARLVLKALKEGTGVELFDAVLLGERHQEREIQKMRASPQLYAVVDTPEGPQGGYPVSPLDDHRAELAVCKRFIYSTEFESLAPEVQSIIVAHAEMHMQYLQREEMQRLQMEAMAQGTPGQPGVASQPRRS